MKVATLNTYLLSLGPFGVFGRSPDRERRASLIGEWIGKEKFDLVFLQEVFHQRMFRRIAEKSGLSYFHTVPDAGLCVLSAHPLYQKTFFPYLWQGSLKIECQRSFARSKIGLALCRMILPDAHEVILGHTHCLARYHWVEGFDKPMDRITSERMFNLLELLEMLRNYSGAKTPVLLAGDFNMNQKSREYEFFTEVSGLKDNLKGFLGCAREWEGLSTYSEENPFVKKQENPGEGILDYVWSSEGDFLTHSVRIAKETDAMSDHRAVIVNLEKSVETNHGLQSKKIPQSVILQMKTYFDELVFEANHWAKVSGATRQRNRASSKLAGFEKLEPH